MASICAVIAASVGATLHANPHTPQNMAYEYCVPEEERFLYGMRDLIVYASSHPSDPSCLCTIPSTYYTQKNLFALGATDLEHEFAAIFENELHDNIVSRIQALLPDCDWGLNVFRLGFDDERLRNPITIHLVVADGALSEYAACKIVSEILAVVAVAPCSKSLHVDVCRASSSSSEADSYQFSLLDRNPDVYNSPARLPYSSIGPAQIDCVGTLSGYIQHCDENGRNTIYALTCRHVIDPRGTLSNKPYVEVSGHRQVTCPAASDHDTTIQSIKDNISVLQSAIKFQTDTSTAREIAILEQALEKAEQYCIDLGIVYATSRLGGLLPQSQGRSDWAIISILNPAVSIENKHVRTSGGFVSFKPIGSLGRDFLLAGAEYFHPGPHFKPVRVEDLSYNELVFKPRSRTTKNCVAGTFNGVRSTQKQRGMSGVRREWCVIALSPNDAVSARGDSGSLILDRDFRPIAMIWGGDGHYFAMGPRDVTYVSSLSKVMRDIEDRLQWTKGSVSMV